MKTNKLTVAICLDDDFGMTFGGRRQSRDRVLCEKAIALAENGKFYINSFSEKLFADFPEPCVNDDMLSLAADGDICFLENMTPPNEATDLIVFKWNRRYPGDMHFEPTKNGFSLVSSEDFEGSSHEKITMEIYKK